MKGEDKLYRQDAKAAKKFKNNINLTAETLAPRVSAIQSGLDFLGGLGVLAVRFSF